MDIKYDVYYLSKLNVFVSSGLVQYLYELAMSTNDSGKSRSVSEVVTIRIILHVALISQSISNVLIGVITVWCHSRLGGVLSRGRSVPPRAPSSAAPRWEARSSHGYLSQN